QLRGSRVSLARRGTAVTVTARHVPATPRRGTRVTGRDRERAAQDPGGRAADGCAAVGCIATGALRSGYRRRRARGQRPQSGASDGEDPDAARGTTSPRERGGAGAAQPAP